MSVPRAYPTAQRCAVVLFLHFHRDEEGHWGPMALMGTYIRDEDQWAARRHWPGTGFSPDPIATPIQVRDLDGQAIAVSGRTCPRQPTVTLPGHRIRSGRHHTGHPRGDGPARMTRSGCASPCAGADEAGSWLLTDVRSEMAGPFASSEFLSLCGVGLVKAVAEDSIDLILKRTGPGSHALQLDEEFKISLDLPGLVAADAFAVRIFQIEKIR